MENYCLEHAVGDHEWVETKGIKWCSGVDCLIDQSGQCGDEQADIFGAGVDGNCVILPHNMSEQDQVNEPQLSSHSLPPCVILPHNMSEQDQAKEPPNLP